ncbi:MAG: hypothetical protein KAI25_02100 [Hyphomicrobiaceae bacterium]|nr:hypothetical protein [Hyphomicrobiaceae bacterium]
MLTRFLNKHKDAIVEAIKSMIISFLKLQVSGGVRGWLIATLLKEFAEEVVEFITINVDHLEIKHKVAKTIDNKDRDNATDTLNDIFN